MDKSYFKMCGRILLVLIFIILSFYIVSFLMQYIYPFLIAFFIALFLDLLVTRIEKRTSFSRLIITTSILLIALFTSFGISLLSILFIIDELAVFTKDFPYYVGESSRIINHMIQMSIDFLNLKPIGQDILFNQIDEMLNYFLEQSLHILNLMMTSLALTVSSFSHFITVIFFITISLFFMTKDMPLIKQLMNHTVSERPVFYITSFVRQIRSTFSQFIKGQTLIAFISATIVLLGLLVFNIQNALLLAILSFMIDFLPYVGIGFIFLPWILYAFFLGQYVLCIKLVIIYMCVILCRQVLEPNIIAHSIGIHPLITLMILFFMLQSFGFFGFILSPLILILISAFYKSGMLTHLIRYIKYGRTL